MHLIIRSIEERESGFIVNLNWQHEGGDIFESKWFDATSDIHQAIRDACPAETYEFEPEVLPASVALPVEFKTVQKKPWWKYLLFWL